MTGSTNWDDVGQRFADLGRRLETTWRAGPDEETRAGLRDASDKVRSALDDVAESIDRAIGSEEVREATRSATAGVTSALAATLHQVAGWIEGATATSGTGSDSDAERAAWGTDAADQPTTDEPATDEPTATNGSGSATDDPT